MLPIMFSTVKCIGVVLVLSGLLVAAFGTLAAQSTRAFFIAGSLALALVLSPSWGGYIAQRTSLGEAVMVDRDFSVEVATEALDLGVSDFSCLQTCGKMT